jgi:hypothetical protein
MGQPPGQKEKQGVGEARDGSENPEEHSDGYNGWKDHR